MARLFFSGFETAAPLSDALVAAGAPAFVTSPVRSGSYALEIQTSSSVAEYAYAATAAAADRDYFYRSYVRISANPANAVNALDFLNVSAVRFGSVRLETDGTLTLRDKDGNQIGSASSALAPDTWYRVEAKFRINSADGNAGTAELRIDGTTVASSSAAVLGTAAPTYFLMGSFTATTTTASIYHDDVGWNDDQGASQNSWCGPEKVILLKPISDNLRDAAWVGGAGGTTNLWNAVDNTPPIGATAGAPSTDLTQIENTTSDATANYDANLQTYTTGGIASGDTVTVVQAFVLGGNNTTTSRIMAAYGVSNPALAEVTMGTGTTAYGTFPTGWNILRTAPAYNPAVALGTSPVVGVRKGTATTNVLSFCLMGLYVAYVPLAIRRSRRVVVPSMPSSTGAYL